MQSMVIIDEVGQRPLHLGKREPFGDWNDVVAPPVNDDRRTGLRHGCGRESRQIEGGGHQEEAGGADRTRRRRSKVTPETRAHQHGSWWQTATGLEQLFESPFDGIDSSIVHGLETPSQRSGDLRQRDNFRTPWLGVLAMRKNNRFSPHGAKCTPSRRRAVTRTEGCLRLLIRGPSEPIPGGTDRHGITYTDRVSDQTVIARIGPRDRHR